MNMGKEIRVLLLLLLPAASLELLSGYPDLLWLCGAVDCETEVEKSLYGALVTRT